MRDGAGRDMARLENQSMRGGTRITGILAGATVLAACSAAPPARGPLPGTDVACLLTATHRDGGGFDQALHACGVTRPDLTGNIALQLMALAAHVPFTIRPIADAELKRGDVAVTGSLIPYPDTGEPYGRWHLEPIL